MIDALTGAFGIYLGTFAIAFVTGLVPIGTVELYLLGLSGWAALAPAQIVVIVLLAAVGQMAAKALMWVGAVKAIDATVTAKHNPRLERWRVRIESWRNKRYWVIAAAAALGVPPFYIISVLAAVLKVPFEGFMVVGLVGRIVRFAVVMVIPIREVLHALASWAGC